MRSFRPENMGARCALLALMVCCCTSAGAQRAAVTKEIAAPTSSKTAAAKPAGAPTAAQPNGQQVAAEAKSGTLRQPTREEIQVLIEGMKAELSTSFDGLIAVKHPDGAVSVDVEGRFQNISIARIEADGSITQSCVHSHAEARHFLQHRRPGEPVQPGTVAKPKVVLEEK